MTGTEMTPRRSGAEGPFFDRLGVDECWRLVRSHTLGRIGFLNGRQLQLTPISYRVDGERLHFRTTSFGPVARHAHHQPIVVQVDDIDGEAFEGWAVQLTGAAYQVVDPSHLAMLWSPERSAAWAASHQTIWIAIKVESIAGQRLSSRVSPQRQHRADRGLDAQVATGLAITPRRRAERSM